MDSSSKISSHAGTALPVLAAIGLSHFLNDTIQSLIPALYPLLKKTYHLSFTELGLITLTFQLIASILQPLVGFLTDRHIMPKSLAIGMGFSLLGLVILSSAPNFLTILIAAGMVGLGSAVFHPEASRVAFMASGGRYGFAQSVFQVGGNAGSSLGPLLAALIVVPFGQKHILWFSVVALVGVVILWNLGLWQRRNLHRIQRKSASATHAGGPILSRRTVCFSIGLLIVLTFSKYIYLASLVNYYTFYLIDKFKVSIPESQIYLFLFLFAVAAGTIIGGPVGDRFGRKRVILGSIFGVAPFTLLLPHVGLVGTAILSIVIGLVLASAFSAILVYAQELVPGRVGMIAGIFFGFAFGLGGTSSVLLGRLADLTNIGFVFHLCAFLPLLGCVAYFLPNLERKR